MKHRAHKKPNHAREARDEAVIYCDASVKPNFCGIGICVLEGGTPVVQVSRRLPHQNSHKAEAMAIIQAIKLGRKRGYKSIRIYSDSKTLVAVATGQTIPQKRLTQKFAKALEALREKIKVTILWVRGHNGKKWNCLCDHLAKRARWHAADILAIARDSLEELWGNLTFRYRPMPQNH